MAHSVKLKQFVMVIKVDGEIKERQNRGRQSQIMKSLLCISFQHIPISHNAVQFSRIILRITQRNFSRKRGKKKKGSLGGPRLECLLDRDKTKNKSRFNFRKMSSRRAECQYRPQRRASVRNFIPFAFILLKATMSQVTLSGIAGCYWISFRAKSLKSYDLDWLKLIKSICISQSISKSKHILVLVFAVNKDVFQHIPLILEYFFSPSFPSIPFVILWISLSLAQFGKDLLNLNYVSDIAGC